MLWLPSYRTVLVALALLTPSGCGPKVKFDKVEKIETGQVKTYFIEHTADKVSVTVKSPGAPVNIQIVYEPKAQEAEKAMQNGKVPPDRIVGKEKTEDKTLDFAPAKKAFAILITPVG